MDIDFNELYEVESENTPEAAEPEVAEEIEGEKAQEVTEPAEVDESTASEDEGSESQSKDENARYAAARRAAEKERDEAIAKAKAEAAKEIDEAFRNSGLIDPYTKKAITSKAEYDAYIARRGEEQKKLFMEKNGMDDNAYDQFVGELPEVKAAREAKSAAEAAEKEAQNIRVKAKIDEQIKAINALDPSIRELSDLTKMPSYGEFYEKVKSGYSLEDAFKLVNFDSLRSASASGAAQHAARNAASKSHLSRTASRGEGNIAVPDDVAAEYRIFNPDATAEEISAHYNKFKK